MNPKPKITIEHLTKRFGGSQQQVCAVDNLSMEVFDREFACIVGPSGCGKTTLLRIVADLETPSAGRVEIVRESADRPLNSMVFQEQSVFPWMKVQDNVEFGLVCRGVGKQERRSIAKRFIDTVGLSDFAARYPHQLSGGMKQRVSLARAFANDPEVLLMDEPFAALDEQTKVILQEELLRIWSQYRKTVLFITHSIDEAITLSDRIIVLTARPGRIKTIIPVGLPRPRRAYDIKASAEYGQLVRSVWEALREEVSPGTGREDAS